MGGFEGWNGLAPVVQDLLTIDHQNIVARHKVANFLAQSKWVDWCFTRADDLFCSAALL